MNTEKEFKKINIDVEISGCNDCPFCKHKYNELTDDMKFHGIPKSVWICDKGAYGKLEKYTSQNMFDSLRNLFTDSKNLDGEYYTGESSRPDYPPYIGCPYFDVDKLSSFVTEVNNISIPNDGITTDEMITLMKKYGIVIEDYELPDDNDDSSDSDNTNTEENEESGDLEGDTENPDDLENSEESKTSNETSEDKTIEEETNQNTENVEEDNTVESEEQTQENLDESEIEEDIENE